MRRLILLLLTGTVLCRAEVTYRVRLGPDEGNRIVTLTAEKYVAAVLAGESSTFRNDEALKAMAVAARTYAARMCGRHAAEGYDFCTTTHCQRADLHDVTGRVVLAARDTAGQLLWFQGEPAFAVYTRSCGGDAESGTVVWPDIRAPYLRVHPDPYCVRAGPQAWTWSATPDRIAFALHASNLKTPDGMERIAIVDKTASGRAKTLLLSGNHTVLISAGSLRFAIGRFFGWNTLRSDLYQVQTSGGHIVFRGAGEGHRVGLCQRGADEMASEGSSYREILAFYYPGTSVGITARQFDWTRLGGENVTVLTARPDADRKLLRFAENVRSEWESKLNWHDTRAITIRVYPTLDSFRNATGEPGWVAARTSGSNIEMQPASVLEEHGALRGTLGHELLHALVEMRAAPGLPVWFREGVVEWLSSPSPQAAHVEQIEDQDLRQRNDRVKAERAYAIAETRVSELVNRYGADAVLTWVARGLPEAVKNSSVNSAATNSR
jgi:stage II sporulation protein D